MSRFGGASKFGGMAAKFGGVKTATTPSYIIERMLASLDPVATNNDGTPRIRSRKRLVGDPMREKTWSPYLVAGGMPAVLVSYDGAKFSPLHTSAGRVTKLYNFTAWCLASDYRSQARRLAGVNEYEAGAENLSGWCLYYMLRELQGADTVSGRGLLSNATVVDEREIYLKPNVVLYALTFAGEKTPDLYDDANTLTMDALGICHTPSDRNNLFETDNETPLSEDFTNESPNVADLTE